MSPEFEDVMGSTDEFPFAFSFLQSSERQPIKSSAVFDLSIYWFYAAAAFLIDGFSLFWSGVFVSSVP